MNPTIFGATRMEPAVQVPCMWGCGAILSVHPSWLERGGPDSVFTCHECRNKGEREGEL